jgi:hypothetical protein
MNKTALCLTVMVAASLLGACQNAPTPEWQSEAQGKDFDVYFLAGQSNMDGFGFTYQLPPELTGLQDGTYIYAGHPGANNGETGGGLGVWAPMMPGFGIGFSSDGQTNALSNRFGPELSFAKRLKDLAPEKNIAIIKASRGGTSLALGASGYGDWALDYTAGNGRNSYDNALTAISRALRTADIDGDGVVDRLTPKGIIWMQGESDAAHTAETAAAYRDNLEGMMHLLRAALWTDDLPVVIGQIKDSGDTPETRIMTFSPEVIAAQNAYADSDPCAAIVSVTEAFQFPEDDPWHYLTPNYITLGEAFAEAVLGLEPACPPHDA